MKRIPPVLPYFRSFVWLLILPPALVVAPPTGAASSETWRTRGSQDLLRATLEGVAVDPEGRMVLDWTRREIAQWDEPIAWSIACGPAGEVYVGTGDEGRVYRVGAGGGAELFVDLPDAEATALAVDRTGNLLVGTSPEGKVYRVGPDRKPQVLFEPGARYIWALLPLADGRVLVASGLPGRLHAIDGSGRARVLYETQDGHVRSLAAAPGGEIALGTSGRGLVVLLNKDGKGRVLLDTRREEVVGLVFDRAGTLYAAALGEERPAVPAEGAGIQISVVAKAPPAKADAAEPPVGEGDHAAVAAPASVAEGAPARPTAAPAASKLFRIDPDGLSLAIWETKTESIFALAAGEEAGVLVGTGPGGTLYSIGRDGELTRRGRARQGPVASIAKRGERYLVAGASPASLRSFGPGIEESGTIESKVHDAGDVASWGRLAWHVEPAREGQVGMEVRAGNTEEPDLTWSDWRSVGAANGAAEGGPTELPPGRYAQWRATLRAGSRGGPALAEVKLHYRRRNAPPRIEAVSILPPGIALQIPPTGSAPAGEPALLANRASRALATSIAGGRPPAPSPRRYYQAGARTALWQPSDPNNDELSFTVEWRRAGEREWNPLAEGIAASFLTWDSRGLEDGWYTLRVRGSDQPDNPAAEALEDEGLSEAFVIDHTPPKIEEARAASRDGEMTVRFRASDTAGRIAYAEYALDGGSWQVLAPEDGVEDSRWESYAFTLTLPDLERHVIVVRVADEGGNWASEQVLPATRGGSRPGDQ